MNSHDVDGFYREDMNRYKYPDRAPLGKESDESSACTMSLNGLYLQELGEML